MIFNWLYSGLGQLADGQRGTDNFRSDIYGYGKGNVQQWKESFYVIPISIIHKKKQI